MRSSATPKVSKKITTKIDNPQKRQQQQKPVSNNAASDFDSAWASFSDSPFDNSFSSGDPFATGGAVEWPTDDDDGMDVKKLNTTNKMRGKNRAEVKSVNVAAPATTKPKKNGIKAARTTTSQNITRPTKETKVKNDDEVEFWGVESDEVTNLTSLNNDWGEKQSDKEADIAALVKYRSGGKGEKATAGSSSRKVTNSVNIAVTEKQVSSSKATTATSSQALGNTAKLKSFFIENNQQQVSPTKTAAAVTRSQAQRVSSENRNGGSSVTSQIKQQQQQQQQQPPPSKLTATSRSQTPTSAISGPNNESPAKPTNIETNRLKSMPRVNSNSYKTQTSPSSTVHSISSPSLPPSSASSSPEMSNKK